MPYVILLTEGPNEDERFPSGGSRPWGRQGGEALDGPGFRNEFVVVNGEAAGSRMVSDGNASGSYSAASGGGEQDTSRRTPRPSRERLGTALLFAAGINVVGLVGNSLTAFMTESTPTWTWFIAPFVGLLVALVIELPGYAQQGRSTPARPSSGHPAAGSQPRPAPRRPLAATLAVTLLLLGGGGWLVTAGASYAVGYFSGNEEGVQLLEYQVITQRQGVTVSILGIQRTPHFTRMVIRVNNGTSNSLSLPLARNAVLTGQDGTTFDADSFRSSWRPEIPAGGQRKGTIIFEGQLPVGSTTVSLSFVTVYARGSEGPRTITVPNIPLKPLIAWASAGPTRD